MNQGYEPTTQLTPPEQPQKSNNTLIIVIVVIALILLCCCGLAVAGWFVGDNVMRWLGFDIPTSLLQTIILV
jgi:hypothetical protein